MFARVQGGFALAGNEGNGHNLGSSSNLEGRGGLGQTEASPYVAFRTDFDKHRVRVNSFSLGSDGRSVLGNRYGNIDAGAEVQTSMDFYALAGNYSYEVRSGENYRVGLGGQLGLYSLHLGVNPLSSPSTREKVAADVLVPMPYAEWETYWRDFTVGAKMAVMSGDFGDANGLYFDFETFGLWQINESYDLKVSFRYLELDCRGRASDRDFDADVTVRGLLISGGVRF